MRSIPRSERSAERAAPTQEFTRAVVNTAPIVLMLCDDDGRMVRFNDTTEELFGYVDDEEMRGRFVWDAFVVEEDRDAVADAFRRVHPLRPVEVLSRWLTKEGAARTIDASIAHIIDGQGLSRRILAGLDITDLVEQREELKAQRDFLAVVARATPSLLVAVERDGTVAPQGVNYAFRELTGYTDGEAIGRRFWDLVAPPELVDEVKHAFEEQVETGVSMEHETAWIGSSGTWRIVAWWLRPLEESGKFIVCGTEITERKAQEAELRASRSRIVEAADDARRRLERNLHDGAQQRLVSLSLSLRLAQARLRSSPEAAAELLAAASRELAVALEELRQLARGLHPAVLAERGLPAALESLRDRAPLPIAFDAVPEGRLPEPVEAAVYYIVVEALTNTVKYAQASSARVAVTVDGRRRPRRGDGRWGRRSEGGDGIRAARARRPSGGARGQAHRREPIGRRDRRPRADPPQLAVAAPGGMPLAAGDLEREPVRGRGQRAHPAWVVAARRVVGEVEVEDEPLVVAAEVRTFDGVEQVAPAAVGRAAARSVGERAEDAAAIRFEPIELERLPGTVEVEPSEAEAAERDGLAAARADPAQLGLRRLDPRRQPQRRVVGEVVETGEGGSSLRWKRRLRVRPEELVAHTTPAAPRALGVAIGTNLGVEGEDAPPPVQ